MSLDRPVRRWIYLVAQATAWLALTGCLRSTSLRSKTVDRPPPEPAHAQAETAAIPPPKPAAERNALVIEPAPVDPRSLPPLPPSITTPAPLELSAAPPAKPAPAQAPAASATPLLDAALERVEAVNRERTLLRQSESGPPGVSKAEDSTGRSHTKPTANPGSEPATELVSRAPDPLPDLAPVPAESARADSSVREGVSVREGAPADEPKPAPRDGGPIGKDAPADEPDSHPGEGTPAAEPRPFPVSPVPDASTEPTPSAAVPTTPALKITDVRLCRRVDGFGQITPMDAALKPGSLALVYCELEGMVYEARGSDFVSRVSSRIELRRPGGDEVVWQRDLGLAEDICRRERQDYYVSYRILLPGSIAPGNYVLRLIQTDQASQASASSDLAVTVTR